MKRRKNLLDTHGKKINRKLIENTLINISADHIKQLEDELLKLSIENAYLKELRRLRLEAEDLLKKQRESSAAF